MNKLPFLKLCAFAACLFFTQSVFAQSKEDLRSCASMEVLSQQLLDDPGLAERMEAIERDIEDYVPTGQRTVITIPVVFHIIHNGDAVGSNENLDELYILEQMEQLNDDFRKLNSDAGNVPAEFAGLHADTEIEFCLAVQDPNGNPTTGINRYNFNQSSWSSGAFNSTVKPATVWDRDNYLNFWTANLSGGLLGYAQFPGGNPNTDGIVCLYSSVGSLDVPHPSGGVYDHGRTATHEVGHWLNLYHIWGDGNCNQDDQVADTPNQNGSHGGCPNHPTVTCGSNDMFMNYMDYVFDNCMIMFSEGQSTRMDAVLTPANGARHSLLSSQGCVPLGASIAFDSDETTEPEGTSSCATAGTRDILVTLNISSGPTLTSVVAINVSGTASADDATVSPTSVVVPAGSSGTETITVTVEEDAYTEANETVVLDLSISSGDLVLGSTTTHTVILTNDDTAPGSASNVEFLNEDFNSNPAGWTIVDGGSTSDTWFYTGNNGNNLNGTEFAFVDSDAAGNGSTSFEQLISPSMNTAGSGTLTLDFDQYFRAWTNGYNETIEVDVFDGAFWQNVYIRSGNNQGSIGGWGAPNHQTIDISAYANANMQLRFTYDGEWDYWWAIDNVIVSGNGPAVVASSTNSGSGFMEADLGPMETVHFYDQNTNNIMMSISNLTAHDYGCTKVEINSSGVSSYLSNAPEAIDITDKNFIVTPEFNNPSGSYEITLYYTREEINGWLDSNTENSEIFDMQVLKAAGEVATATNLELEVTSFQSYGTDYSFTATYGSGFSGFGLGNENTALPVELVQLTARADGKHIDVDWSTAVELNNKGFEVQRSTNPATGFESIGWVDGRGDSEITNDYHFADENVRSGIWYYYRLKQIDFDAKFEYSPIVSARIEGTSLEVFPNPVRDQLQVRLISSAPFDGQVEVVDVLGTVLMTKAVKGGSESSFYLEVSDLPTGVYFIRLKDDYVVQDAIRFLKRG